MGRIERPPVRCRGLRRAGDDQRRRSLGARLSRRRIRAVAGSRGRHRAYRAVRASAGDGGYRGRLRRDAGGNHGARPRDHRYRHRRHQYRGRAARPDANGGRRGRAAARRARGGAAGGRADCHQCTVRHLSSSARRGERPFRCHSRPLQGLCRGRCGLRLSIWAARYVRHRSARQGGRRPGQRHRACRHAGRRGSGEDRRGEDHGCFGADPGRDVEHSKAPAELRATGGFEMLTGTFRHPDAQKLFQTKG